MIRQRRIRVLDRYVRHFAANTRVVAAFRVDSIDANRLVEAGFEDPVTEGQWMLPSAHLGLAAKFNAEGREEVHRDVPMETVYRQAEWTHEQWNGPYTETITEIVERPYQRYKKVVY